jgi:glycosyltransferase involved in cell wall biosynthesis
MAALLPALAARGVEVAALVHEHRRGRPVYPSARPEGAVTLYRVPSIGRLLYTPISPRFPFWLNRVIGELSPDLLHLHLPNPSAFWTLASPAARRLPLVVHWHSDVVASQYDRRLATAYRLYRPLEQQLLRRSAAVVATSPPYLTSSVALAPWRERCHVIPLGLDRDDLPRPTAADRARAEAIWGDGAGRVLAVGRLTYYKGYERLIRAADKLADAKVVVVGEGELRARLERLIAQKRLSAKVLLAAACPGPLLHALLESCDCLCLPSIERTEAFGLVLLEAMAHGKAVVASDVPGSGMSWVVEAGRTGLLVPPDDVIALAGALRRLLGDAELRERFGARGKARFEQQFSIAAVADELLSLYREVV